MLFTAFLSFIILQRLSELLIAKRNEKWLLKNGAIEYGKAHYPVIVLMHTLFFVSMIIEYNAIPDKTIDTPFLIVCIILILTKAWVIGSLGNYWNTKIFRIPNTALVKKGAYKYVKHPNYIIVVCELAAIPLVFHLYYTAIIFSLLNALMLSVRLREENKILIQ
ncbi:MAG: isoprenylcysteine carboxylmethyltransferase family protein [Bacteroidota bacterium]